MAFLKFSIRTWVLIVLSFLFLMTSSSLYSYTIFDQRTKQLIMQAKAGEKRAQYKLGRAYLRGTTVKYNRYTARKWLLKSASQNYYKAWFALGEMYYTSKYRMRNYRIAFKWFMKAAKQNHGQSQYYIALHYFTGKGVAKKNFSALIWAARAEKNGVAEASDLLGAIHLEIVKVSNKAKLAEQRKIKARALAKTKARLRAQARKVAIAQANIKAKKEARARAKAKRIAISKAKREARARAKAKRVATSKARADFRIKTLAKANTRLKELTKDKATRKAKVNKIAAARLREQQQLANEPDFDLMSIPDVRKLLYTAKWSQNGGPSDYIPSVSSECVQVESSINCTSRRIRNKFLEYTVHFRIMSTITDFRAKGEFTIRYRKHYLLVLRDNPKTKAKMPALGMEDQTSQLHCRVLSRTQIHCVKPDNSKVLMTTGLTGISGSVTSLDK